MIHRIPFAKYEGCGNDYLYVVLADLDTATARWLEENASRVAPQVSDRHFGIGSDGLVLVAQDDSCTGRMVMFNADGSRSETCGNALRCIGKILGDRQPDARDITIATDVGTCPAILDRDAGGVVTHVTVDMGAPSGEFSEIPLDPSSVRVLSEASGARPGEIVTPVELRDGSRREVRGWPVSMGNPHCVVFVDDEENAWLRDSAVDLEQPLVEIGRPVERASCFPQGANIEFVSVVDGELFQRTWERGSGETLACGSGACAVAVAACARGDARSGQPVPIRLRGGSLEMTVSDRVSMRGPAREVFQGSFELRLDDSSTCYDTFRLPTDS